jgi:hypothetical protein
VYVMEVIIGKFSFVYGPPDTEDRRTLMPATFDELAANNSVTECDACWTAMPESEMVTVGLVALLPIVTLPFRVPEEDGAKVTFKTAEFPAAKINPEETPTMLNPAPESVTFEIATLEVPLFVSVTDRRLLLPTVIFP